MDIKSIEATVQTLEDDLEDLTMVYEALFEEHEKSAGISQALYDRLPRYLDLFAFVVRDAHEHVKELLELTKREGR